MKSTAGITFDPADSEYSPLVDAAGRIAKLWDEASNRSDPFLSATLELLLGAVSAFVLAKQSGYEHRSGPTEADEIKTRVGDLESGRVRTDGKWIAGFHFNSVIVRIAAVFHRALKIALEKSTTEEDVGPLRCLAREWYPSWTATNAWTIHGDVNVLKHDANGLPVVGREATPEHAIKAIDEILNLLEEWLRRRIRGTGSGCNS